MRTIYYLKNDINHIKNVQEATLHTDHYGLRVTHGLFGSDEWWEKIESGELPLATVKGTINRVYMSGHNDFPEFEIVTLKDEKTIWARWVDDPSLDSYYKEGSQVELDYVVQMAKRGFGTGLEHKCVIAVRIEN